MGRKKNYINVFIEKEIKNFKIKNFEQVQLFRTSLNKLINAKTNSS